VSNKTSAGPASKPIGVFVLEDQEIVRRGIRVLLEAEPDIEVTGEASTAASALARIPALRPGVAVLDVQLPDGDRVSVCREVRSRAPEVACLMLTAFSDDEALLGSIMAERPATCSSRSAARIWSARSAWSPPVSRCWMLARRAR
jgi:DNA-binding NarL/FixJ family response regulator